MYIDKADPSKTTFDGSIVKMKIEVRESVLYATVGSRISDVITEIDIGGFRQGGHRVVSDTTRLESGSRSGIARM